MDFSFRLSSLSTWNCALVALVIGAWADSANCRALEFHSVS
jgi:hypothetical protein